jgi:hypothetical protein
MSRIEAVASNILAVADIVERDSLRIQAIMGHLGLPDVEFEDDGRGQDP